MTRLHKKTLPFFLLLVAPFGVSMTGCAKPAVNLQGLGQIKAVEFKDGTALQADAALSDLAETPSSSATPQMSAEGYENTGDACLRNGDLFMALLQYERSLKIQPQNARIYYKEGLVFLAAEQYDEAIHAFKKFLAEESQSAPAYEGLGQAYFRMKAYSGAKENFLKALALDPSLWRAHTFLGVIYDREKKYEMAIREHAAAISQRPSDGLLYNNLGVSYMLARRYEQAVRSFEKALEKSGQPKQKIYNNLGLALCGLADYDGALEAFRKAAGEPQALNNIGCVYLAKDEIDRAIGYFEKAIELSPEFYNLASENMRRAKMAPLMK
jgi:tetratricopeptide (TPR) repeat protein